MKRMLMALAAGACAGLFAGLGSPAQAGPDMSLTRLDCGTPQPPIAVNQRFSDIFAYPDLKLQFVYSCYLVKHGDDYLLWDTGHAMTTPNVAPKLSIVDQLAKLDLKPEQIKYVGISHYHALRSVSSSAISEPARSTPSRPYLAPRRHRQTRV